jgi:hypothetical protein
MDPRGEGEPSVLGQVLLDMEVVPLIHDQHFHPFSGLGPRNLPHSLGGGAGMPLVARLGSCGS